MRRVLRALWRVVSFPFRLVWWLLTLPVRGMRGAIRFLTGEPDDRPIGDVLTSVSSQPNSLLEHIEDLRKHLLRMMVGLAITIGVSFVFSQSILAFLAAPVGGLEALRAIDVTEPIGVYMRAAMLSGFTLAVPYIAFELWLFVAPALYPRTRILGLVSIPLVAVLFLAGMAFAYRILLPPALHFLLSFTGIAVDPRPSTTIAFVIGVMFWSGIAFQFPLVMYVLTAMRLIQPRALLRQWRIALVAIAILSAAITPTPDPVNMSLVMVPMILLYFIGVGLSFLAAARHRTLPAAAE
jgi:sec-independent protein translocase protein TatC